jgi:hypothetical protein
MPFLFVDYDSGAGGERFCAELAGSAQCEPMLSQQYDNGRTKVEDVFGQAFLMPRPKFPRLVSHPTLYTVVPSHRNTHLAYRDLKDVRSIRIAMPTDEALFQRLQQDHIDKMYLTREPIRHFVGYIKILQQSAVDLDFVRKIKYGMQTVEIYLLSQAVEPTEENKNRFFDYLRNTRHPEPEFDYDLVIPYGVLVDDKPTVARLLKATFGIDYDFNSAT